MGILNKLAEKFDQERKSFFAEGYLHLYPDVESSGMDPWEHYKLFGKSESRSDGRSYPEQRFFAEGYLALNPDVRESGMDPWRHYVLFGHKEGRGNGTSCPKERFFPQGYLALYPDVADSGMDPWRHYVLFGKKEGRGNGISCPKDRFFPEGYLALYPDVARAGMDPWRHYVLYGRKEGRSNGFDYPKSFFYPSGYLEMYPKVAKAGMNPWYHYAVYGKKEKREPSIGYVSGSAEGFDPARTTCIVVAHEASATGCPINSWNMAMVLKRDHNVIFISLSEKGPLFDVFRKDFGLFICLNQKFRYDERAIAEYLEYLGIDGMGVKFCIANSICSRGILPFCSAHGIPSMLFIHEFADYLRREELVRGFVHADQVVYSSRIVMRSALDKLGIEADLPILPQGMSASPMSQNEKRDFEKGRFQQIAARKAGQGEKIVACVGTVNYRKGVDIFIRTAAAMKKAMPEQKLRFLWAGGGYEPDRDQNSMFYRFQVKEFGLENEFEFLGPVKKIDHVYEVADILLLTSILDPLPGVVIEAMSHALPVVCFDRCSGFADVFSDAGLGGACVAGFLDVDDMASKAAVLLRDEEIRASVSARLKELREKEFDMDSYVEKVVGLVPAAAQKMRNAGVKAAAGFSVEEGTQEYAEALALVRADQMGLHDFSLEKMRAKFCDSFDTIVYSPCGTHGTTVEEQFEFCGFNTGNNAYNMAAKKITDHSGVLNWYETYKHPHDAIALFPCANQLGPHADMRDMYVRIKERDMPVVAIGLGAQVSINSRTGEPRFPEVNADTLKWVDVMVKHAVSDKPNIGVRGEFTARYMEHLGYGKNIEVLGCETLFINESPELGRIIAGHKREPLRVALAAGCQFWSELDILENSLSRIATDTGGAFVCSSELTMCKIGSGEAESIPSSALDRANAHFRKDLSREEFVEWTKKYGKCFFNVEEWMDYYRTCDFVIGPRIHGVMLALQVGIPAVCVAFDTRTLELCEVMKVPYVMASEVKGGVRKEELMDLFRFDAAEFDANRRMLANRWVEFMKNNRIRPSSHILGIAKP